jgi:hypothetical protein
MNQTSPEAVKSALGRQPFDLTSINVNSDTEKRFVGRVSTLFSYEYAKADSCYPQKWADFSFINGKLEAYHFFSELDEESHFTPDPTKLAALKPGKTSCSTVINALGTPNYWSTGISLLKDQAEEIGYYWIAEHKPYVTLKRLLISFDSHGIIMAPPLIDNNLNDTSMFRWLCEFPPPTPAPSVPKER